MVGKEECQLMLEDQRRLNVLLNLRCVGNLAVWGQPAGGSYTDTTLVRRGEENDRLRREVMRLKLELSESSQQFEQRA